MSSAASRRDPDRPWLGVGGVVLEGGRVLLVRRGNEPFRDHWSIPGGAVESGELLEDAVRRELLEETGLIVEPAEVIYIFESIRPGANGGVSFHFVVIDYLCRPIGGEMRAGGDVSAAAWFERNALPEPITASAPLVIEKAFASAQLGSRLVSR